jgi:hypothetical protein
MLDKTLKVLLPITLIITIIQTVNPLPFLNFLNPFSMVLTSILVYSIGWVISGLVYSNRSTNYSLARHIGLAAIFHCAYSCDDFRTLVFYPYIVGKSFVFRFLSDHRIRFSHLFVFNRLRISTYVLHRFYGRVWGAHICTMASFYNFFY